MNSSTDKNGARAAKGEPVAYVVRALSDGSIGSEIAPINYLMFEENMAKLKSNPWVVNGKAEIVPLYLASPSASAQQSAAIREALIDLVALKDLKEWIEDGVPGVTDASRAEVIARYEREKEPAWEAARIALEASPSHEGTNNAASQDGGGSQPVDCEQSEGYVAAKAELTDQNLGHPTCGAAPLPSEVQYDYTQGDHEGDETYALRLVGRARKLERELAEANAELYTYREDEAERDQLAEERASHPSEVKQGETPRTDARIKSHAASCGIEELAEHYNDLLDFAERELDGMTDARDNAVRLLDEAVEAHAKAERELAEKTRDADHFFQLSGKYLEQLSSRSSSEQRGELCSWCFHPKSARVSATLTKCEASGIYVASRVKQHEVWKAYRAKGWKINSTWIDEAGDGETADFGDLWLRIRDEIARSHALVFYAAGVEDFPFKGALVEVGMALAMGKPVIVALENVMLDGRTLRQVGSWLLDRKVIRCDTLEEAMDVARGVELMCRPDGREAG